jgi:putative type I site-specific deoxyribonuclease
MMQIVSLSDAITLQRGFDLPTSQRRQGKYPVVASTGTTTTHDKFKVKGPGVVIGRSGSIGGGQYVESDFWPLNTTLWVKDFKGNDEKFIYYTLKSLDFSSFNVGAAVPTLNRNHLSALKVRIPDVDKQKKIANILGSLDEKIELNRRMNKTLEQLGQALFRHYFVDKARQSNGNIQTIPLGKKLHPKRGRSLQARDMICGDTPVISGGLKPAGFHNEANTTAPVITISASGANAGFVSVWGEPVWSADSSYIDSTITKYVYTYYLFLKNKQKEIYDMQTGSGQPHIYPKHIELLEIADLSECEFNDFEQRVRPLFDMIHENKKEIDYLSNIRDLLLPKLISGKIKI